MPAMTGKKFGFFAALAAFTAPALAQSAADSAAPTAPYLVDASQISTGDTAWMLTSTALVLLMAVREQRAIGAALLARGWPATTPAALAFGASSAESETWTGTIADLAAGNGPGLEDRPGTLIIGDVVRLRAVLTNDELARDEGEMTRSNSWL